jgi:phospholipid/cholesterol/gamma-HCH transport system substrate-binding protein
MSDKEIDIVPNRSTTEYLKPGTVVCGKNPIELEGLVPKAEQLLDSLKRISDAVGSMVSDKQLKGHLDRSFNNIEEMTARLDKMAVVITNTIAGSQGDIHTIASNTALASQNLLTMSKDLESFTHRGDVQENMRGTLVAARDAAESLDRTAKGLEKLATNPELQQNIRETVESARKTVGEAEKIMNRVGNVVGAVENPKVHIAIPTRKTSLDGVVIPSRRHFRATVSTSLSLAHDRFLSLGIYDLGGSNNIILEPGQSLDANTDLRYGLYASRLGVGLDHAFSNKTYGSLNLYNPDAPRLDLQLGYMVDKDWSVLLGLDKAFKDNEVTIGARFTK